MVRGISVYPADFPLFLISLNQIVAAGSDQALEKLEQSGIRLPLFHLHQEVMLLVVREIRIPEEVDAKLDLYSKHFDFKLESVIVFALVRFVEIQGWLFGLWR